MKKILFSLVATLIATVSFAQTSLLATLSHDGTISTFYGTTALKDALEKAEHGDAITLSAGQFQAANITKAVTLRGAGMSISNDSIGAHESTIVQGDFEVNIADSVSQRVIVEGIYFASKLTYKNKVRNALFMKSRFGTITSTDGVLQNSTFIHCRVAEEIKLTNNSNACMVNCVVWNPYNKSTTATNFEFDNCVVTFNTNNNDDYSSSSSAGNVINSYYKNCVVMINSYTGNYVAYGDYSSHSIPYSCTAVNCVGISYNSNYNNLFCNISSKSTTNVNIAKPADIFKQGSFGYNDMHSYELTDAAKTKYLGADGKQVGLYGGSIPYEEDPTTPQITKCNVAAKSTADGKLSVDIEVKAAEY